MHCFSSHPAIQSLPPPQNPPIPARMLPQNAQNNRIGIIDIGSNSIRLVVYDAMKRAPTALYNEKVICQLGKGLSKSGKLNEAGVAMANAAIGRFLAMGHSMGASELHIIATAAVRGAKDGKRFVQALEKKHNIRIHIISGAHEAELGALGICASVYQPSGITGDLGGGSMELVALDGFSLRKQVTLPIGAIRLMDETGGTRAKLEALIDAAFQQAAWIKDSRPEHFYAIGGSFRALAKMHMEAVNYPLHILHEYTVDTPSMQRFLQVLADLPSDKLADVPGASGKRAVLLPAAIAILQRFIELAAPKVITFSASGIREGYLYQRLPPYLREQDVLVAACTEFAQRTGKSIDYAKELMEWMNPLFAGESEQSTRLRIAFCLLADVASHIHPEYRSEWAMLRVLQSALTGITHEERVQLALALYHRYQFKLQVRTPVLDLLSDEAKRWALLIGSAANLAYHLSGSIAGTLPHTSLGVEKQGVTLSFSKEALALKGEAVDKRLKGLDEAFRKFRSN